MLDLSQFEESYMGVSTGLTISAFRLLLTECRLLQENNRELDNKLIKYMRRHNLLITVFGGVCRELRIHGIKLNCYGMIAKNKEHETNDRPTDKSTI